MKRALLPLFIAACFASIAHSAGISHRKADLAIQVQSISGAPLEGATVEIEMLNHAFRFGCAVTHRTIHPESSDYDPFIIETLQKYFNSATYGNYMKWSYYERYTEEENLAIAALPQSFQAFNGPDNFKLRGHVTIWGSEYQLPAELKANRNPTPQEVHDLIINHIEAYHTTFKAANIDTFDLYNEHMNIPQLLIDRIADPNDMAAQAAEVATWFNKAKEVDPNAFLYINDYNVLNDWNGDDRRVVAYKQFIDAVRDAGGAIDGIGLQAHMDRPTTTKADVTRRLDLLAAPMAPTANHPEGLPGLRIEITELDLSIRNRFFNNTWGWPNPTMEQEVAVARAVLEGAFEHPAVDGITIWGFDDFNHWRGNALLYDNLRDTDPGTTRVKVDPVLKETGQLWIDKVKGEWWEDHSGTSSPNGEYVANTFKGTHRVTVTFNGESKQQIVSLSSPEDITFNFAATADDATSYDQWAGFIDWQGADSARDADPDGDGNSNLKEYFFGQDPLVLQTTDPRSYLSSDQSNGQSLDFFARAAIQSIGVEVLYSTDLASWTRIQDLAWFGDPPELETVTIDGTTVYRLNIGKNTGFFRLEFSEK
ncbi:endo-1,4-beta-xylanase [Pelagicoccus enzymogenes]|uniref:endo-1,4-beta-xylanase n=1 Tax=Pelagicoccus enzymogenes TaxID=2773457 RepID=UPI00280E4441|nr:endo-1,4-beta-xylanase [Pelagicoccus enzymogenes]MDQ8197192.1 endo-1,4-beta-xylanase [Pelagicoccus enzymogenes]